jgi:hypothetical protein
VTRRIKKKKDIPLYYFVQWDYECADMMTAKDAEDMAVSLAKSHSRLKTKKARQRFVDDLMKTWVDGKEAYIKVSDMK